MGNSVISLGLGLGGGKVGDINGRLAGSRRRRLCSRLGCLQTII